MTDDGFDAVEEKGRWFWVYETPGAACFRSHVGHDTKKSALAAGRKWLNEWHDEDPRPEA